MKTAGLNLTLRLSFHGNGSLLANQTRYFIRSILCRDNSPPTSVNQKTLLLFNQFFTSFNLRL